MKKLRKILTLCIALLMVMQVILPTISQAVDTVKLNIQNQRPYNDNDGDGTVGNDVYTLVRQAIQTVFKIGEQDENGNLSFNTAYYCLRGGLGFGSTEEILAAGVDYTKLADLSDSNSVMEYFKDTIGYDIPEENYNAISWIADNMYLPKSEYADEMKQDLLNDAGIASSELTDDDIEVVQQIALWYFTNYDENGEANSVSLSATTDLANLLQINSVQPNNDLTVSYNKNRASQINTLYKYFIENATEKYEENKTIAAEKLELDKTLEPSIETKVVPGTTVNAYVVGPFKINEVQKGSLDYTFSYTLKYKTSDTQTDWTIVEIDNAMGIVYLSDENGTALDRTKDVEDMIAGDEFYITMLKDVLGISNIEEFGIDISHDTYYYNTYAELLIAEADDQPVLKVEKERVEDPGSDSIIVQKEEEPQKEFDLSLRKFITGINGEELTGEISRVPAIYLESLRNGTGTTAIYEHPKTPVYLKRGDIITYTIRIYNEGELDGYAKEVTDYLCDSLELVENSTINEKYNWVLAEDGKTLTTDYLANSLIKAYDGTVTTTEDGWQKSEDGEDGLYYADLQIECRIKETATVGINLPNVAEISDDLSEGTTDIDDRDSTPDSLTDDDVRNYENNPWYEDDDDYERVIIEPDKVFDLSLRKYITKVNDVEITNIRVPEINVSALDAGTSTTAEYNHRKDPIEVKPGDLVTYNLTIYNEGEATGRATKVVDQLPTGLEFVGVKSGNFELESYNTDTNRITLKETTNNTDLIAKQDGEEPTSTTIEIVCEVTAKVAETDQVLTNVAWIAEDYNADNNQITDRDSKPEITPEVNKDNMADYVGKENKEDLSDADYYYKGQEDDDDFEKVIIKGKEFDLSLRKYITHVNHVSVLNRRIPNIDVTALDAGTSTTAEYRHRKDPVEAKPGDLVTYNLTIYNEGEISGRATKVVDQLPTGLEFVEVKSGNYELEGYDKELNKVTLKETANNTNLDAKEEGREPRATTIEIVCKVTAKVTEIDQVLTNVAWIAEDYNAENDEITDRDSKPETTPNVNKDNMVDYVGKENKEDLSDADYYYKGQEDDDDFEKIVIRGRGFDLSLRKYITKVNDVTVTDTRIPEINTTGLDAGVSTTAEYNHKKDPVEVKTGDLVTYNLTIYNEGEISGRATKVVDQLPTGLEFVEVKSENYELESYDKDLNKVTLKETTINTNLDPYEEGRNIQSTTIEIVCKVTGKMSAEDEVLTNVAWIAEDYNAENDEITDRDSKPEITPDVNKDNMADYVGNENKEDLSDADYYYKGQEDDDDFEKVIIKTQEFDLALRKYISNVERKGRRVEFSSRVPEVDTTPLQEGETTAEYNHTKELLTVKQGDIITYKLRIYNEGHVDGYATEITDYIPEGLGFLNGYSGNSNWLIDAVEVDDIPLVGEKGFYKTENDVPDNGTLKNEDLSSITIVTGKGEGNSLKIKDYISLRDELIKKYGAEVEDGDLYQESVNDENDGLFYQEVEVTCIVLAPNTCEDTITNIAEISKDKAVDDLGEEVEIEDRDSNPESLTEEERKDYENNPWYEDDDDYEPVQLKYFDLALRKFITGVNETEVNTRVPEVKISEEGKITYVHTKTPIKVVDNDNVTYTIRVYNEGTIAGYAEEIEDDIPEGLIFLPDDATNKEYGWKMYFYDEDNNLVETNDVEKATVIRTNYLSEANGTIDEETGKNSNLLEAFDKKTMDEPDYRDVKVVFNVSQEDIPEENVSGIVENKAHITEDSEDDEDSIPDEWNDGEDDQDKEYIYVQKFDLALFKWVSQTIVTVDGKTATTETGFKPNVGKTEQEGDDYRNNEDEEPIASVTIDKKKINSTVVKFVYNIKVVNEGELPGYATEITDYIPEGLKFVQEDNPLWTLNEGNKITTRALETKLLEPGESAEVQVVFTWINDANNLGLKTNIAAITEDYNDKGVEDDDSTPSDIDLPNYEEEQEDDDDFALVILTLKTGKETTYIWLIFLTVTIISIGITLIKKYVL